jgi:hypothetical protein
VLVVVGTVGVGVGVGAAETLVVVSGRPVAASSPDESPPNRRSEHAAIRTGQERGNQ